MRATRIAPALREPCRHGNLFCGQSTVPSARAEQAADERSSVGMGLSLTPSAVPGDIHPRSVDLVSKLGDKNWAQVVRRPRFTRLSAHCPSATRFLRQCPPPTAC